MDQSTGTIGKGIGLIYEDNHLLVVRKPFNMPSQRDESNDPDMLTVLKDYIKQHYGKPGNVYLGLVHRLDRPAGGVMVFARTSKAASRLSALIRMNDFKKTYLAVVRGKPENKSGRLEHYLLKDERTNTVYAAERKPAGIKTDEVNEFISDSARKAVLEYTVLESRDGLSLVRIDLHTGRPHQIRVQFSSSGCPLYGDMKYGAKLNKSGQQLALWSAGIEFKHPVKDEEVAFYCPPPGVFPWNRFKTREDGLLNLSSK